MGATTGHRLSPDNSEKDVLIGRQRGDRHEQLAHLTDAERMDRDHRRRSTRARESFDLVLRRRGDTAARGEDGRKTHYGRDSDQHAAILVRQLIPVDHRSFQLPETRVHQAVGLAGERRRQERMALGVARQFLRQRDEIVPILAGGRRGGERAAVEF